MGGRLPTPQAHGLGSTFADGKYDLQRMPFFLVSEDYLWLLTQKVSSIEQISL